MLDPHCGAERVGPTRPCLDARVVTLLAPAAGAWRGGGTAIPAAISPAQLREYRGRPMVASLGLSREPRPGKRQPTCLPPLPACECNDIGSQGRLLVSGPGDAGGRMQAGAGRLPRRAVLRSGNLKGRNLVFDEPKRSF
jgi:hypothetical protein